MTNSKNILSQIFLTLVLLVLGFSVVSCRCLSDKKSVQLFNGKDLAGWSYLTADPQVKMDQVWSVQDGIIVCQGTPIGAIYRGPEVTNFRLAVEYRWAPGTKPGNSGIFSRIKGQMKPIPQAVEVQLMHGNAGDTMGLQGRTVAAGQPRFFEIKGHAVAGDVAGVKKTADLEKPAGEWNRVEILATGPRYQVWVNGTQVNDLSGVEVVSGPVGLQSEGGVIHFRNVVLTRFD